MKFWKCIVPRYFRESSQSLTLKSMKRKKNARLSPGVVTSRSRTIDYLQRTHIGQEVAIRLGLAELVDQQLHRFYRREWVQDFPQHPDALQVFPGNEQLFLTGAGALDIDGREDTLVDQFAVENDFHVAGALELFEDDFVHARPGVNQGGGDDGE